MKKVTSDDLISANILMGQKQNKHVGKVIKKWLGGGPTIGTTGVV